MNELKKSIFKQGSYIYIENDENANKVFIVESGLIELNNTNENLKINKQSAKPGDIFGFISALANRPRMGSAIAKVESVVIEFTREKFLEHLQLNRDIAIKIINNFADELRVYDEMVFSLNKTKDFLSDDIKLFNLGEFYFNHQFYKNAFYIFSRIKELYPHYLDNEDFKRIVKEIKEKGNNLENEPVKDSNKIIYSAGQIVFCEHEPGNELYIIKSGKVEIVKISNGNEILLSILKDGDIFGELAIASEKPRNATAICTERTELMPVNKASLFTLLEQSPELLKKIFTAISERIWFTYIRMEIKLYKRPLTKIYAFLENKLLEERISLKNKNGYIFDFSVDTLFKMADIDKKKLKTIMEELCMDNNLLFNFGQIKVANIDHLVGKTKAIKIKDNLGTFGQGQSGSLIVNDENDNDQKTAKVKENGKWKDVENGTSDI